MGAGKEEPPPSLCIDIVPSKVGSSTALKAAHTHLTWMTEPALFLVFAASVLVFGFPVNLFSRSVQASEKTLSHVVEEILLWQPGGIPFQLHLIHAALLRPDGVRKPEDVQPEVKPTLLRAPLCLLAKRPHLCSIHYGCRCCLLASKQHAGVTEG